MAAKDNDRQSDLAVMDANEYKQKRRLRRILDVHDKVEDKAAEAYDRYVDGEINTDGKNITLQRNVQQFIRECWNLLVEYEDALDDDELNEYFDKTLGHIEFEHQQNVTIAGLDQFLMADEFYIEEWTEKQEARHGPDQTKTYNRQHTIPEHISWQAYLLLRQFLDQEKDIEVKFENMDDTQPIIRGFDQSGEEPASGVDDVEYNGDPDL